MYARADLRPTLRDLARRQLGVLRRDQLVALGIDSDTVDTHVAAERWATYGSRVVVLQNAAMTRAQLMWAAVLHAGYRAALASLTALEHVGLGGFDSPAIHVLVPRGADVPPMPGVVVHESRRFGPADVHPARTPPQTRTERAVIDAGAWQRSGRFACGLLAAAVQQRVTTVPLLREALSAAGAIRHRRLMAASLDDIEGGAHSLSEIDVGAICRRAGLAPPQRQRVRVDPRGRRRYLDCEWELPNGRIVVLEVDGMHHMEVTEWWRDMVRERSVVISGRTVLRCSSVELRVDPAAIISDLRAAGVPALR